jgi:hypothetical protein
MSGIEPILTEDIEQKIEPNQKWPLNAKRIITLLSIICILLIISFIVYVALKNKSDDDDDDEIQSETRYDFMKYTNILYTEDIIINSFKKGGINYNETMGEINNGDDYKKTDRNVYNLFIPYIESSQKKKYNKLLLYLHSGGWKEGYKEEIEDIESLLFDGFITVNMGYTLINDEYKDYNPNVFRIIDEITACIKHVKLTLKNFGFDPNKLELVLSGSSAGGHLSLLYANSIKNPPLPIKFVVEFAGPVTLEPNYFRKVKGTEALGENDFKEIDKVLNDDITERLAPNDKEILKYMNSFFGNKYNEEELEEMLQDGRLDENNEKYRQMFNVIVNGFPTHYINSNSVPIICVYGGKDEVIGIGHLAYLYSLNQEYNKKINFLYSQNASHNVFKINDELNYDLWTKISTQIKIYSDKYFNK